MEGPPEGPPTPEPTPEQERTPDAFKQVKEFIRLTPEEELVCAECTPENKEALIAWYVREQVLARKTPDNRAGISLDIKAGVMQYVIAKDIGQRDEALGRLWEAQNSALQEGMDDLAAKADAASVMLRSV